jgi:DNA invertase Pin-like site-specific DNA recombinase
MRLVAYLRVSTDAQAERGLGLDVQEEQVRRWARANGHRIFDVATDAGVSGSNGIEERRALLDAIRMVEAGEAHGVVVARLDRLARTLTTQEAILAYVWGVGGRVFSVDDGEILEDDPDDPYRTAMRQIRGVFAQLERALIVSRMRAGRRAKAELGGFAYGAPPYGYRAEGGGLVEHPDEQATIARIRELRAEGLSLRVIAERLTADGHAPPRGARWHPNTLARIIGRLEEA